MQNISPYCNEEVNYIDHSIYYSDQDYRECIARSKGALRILSLNCGGLNAKFDRLNFFLAECNNDLFLLHVITLQETYIKSNSDIQHFELLGYTLVYDEARINSFGAWQYMSTTLFHLPGLIVTNLNKILRSMKACF